MFLDIAGYQTELVIGVFRCNWILNVAGYNSKWLVVGGFSHHFFEVI